MRMRRSWVLVCLFFMGSIVFISRCHAEIVESQSNHYIRGSIEAYFEIDSNLQQRIIQKKFLPFLSSSINESHTRRITELEITLLPNGEVDEIVRLQSDSGDPEFNALADEAVRMFCFAPLSDRDKAGMQKGIVRFVLVDKKETADNHENDRRHAFEVYGKLKDRKRIKIYLPRYPRWAEEKGIETQVALKFLVKPNGTVQNVFIEKSSGYGEFDQIAKQALGSFLFEPLGKKLPQEDQKGVLIFYFRLSK